MTVRVEVRLPDLGEGIVEGAIGAWLAHPGDAVTEDQPLVEVVTDKASVEIPSPATGRLAQAIAVSGSVVPVGSVLAVLEVDSSDLGGESARASTATSAATSAEARAVEVAATPAARRLASRLGIDLAGVGAAAASEVIREDDVRVYAHAHGYTIGPTQELRREEQPQRADSDAFLVRSVIASRLTNAAAVPTVTNVDEADFSAVRSSGVSPLTALAFVASRALLEHPKCNMLALDGKPVPQHSVHLGIATQAEAGLVVPVVRHAETLGVAELDAAIKDVSSRARAGRLRPEELSGSTFTITSAGRMSGQWSTPLLNLPEVAILGLYRIADRPVARDGAVVIRPMGNLSMTFDHRYLDGMVAAAFLQSVIDRLESWRQRP
jgi:pyruvate/2-oxoglutarate dehydrogenase complex dihydrolipoamide acyltransferase (E2) component